MLDDFTFGWEAEFQTNVPALVQGLHGRGLCGSPEMHGYHCRCETCDFSSPYVFRAQTDSSCGGEVISGIMRDLTTAREAMDSLQALAVEVDAEPSLQAGLHVHVGVRHLSYEEKADALWAYLRWENILGDIVATGRWPAIRDANERTRSQLAYLNLVDWEDELGSEAPMPWIPTTTRRRYDPLGPMDPLWIERTYDVGVMRRIRNIYLDQMWDLDRHGWLNLQTRDQRTFEFRLWNSTRVAWRMEMFSRMSLLFVTPEAVEQLNNPTTNPTRTNLLAIAGRHDPDLKRLLQRQFRAPKTHDPFTAVGGMATADEDETVAMTEDHGDWLTRVMNDNLRPARATVTPSPRPRFLDPAPPVDPWEPYYEDPPPDREPEPECFCADCRHARAVRAGVPILTSSS